MGVVRDGMVRGGVIYLSIYIAIYFCLSIFNCSITIVLIRGVY